MRVFHLLGADIIEGFGEFRRLYKERRDEARFSECDALVRLLREYEAILGTQERGWLRYYEAEVAIDSRDWSRAKQDLLAVLGERVPADLRSVALLALGSVLRRSGILRTLGNDVLRLCC
jgi:hypothetical protein